MTYGTQIAHMVVVGASLAGLRAVEGARESGFEGLITLVGAEEHLPYDRPPLSKAVLTEPELPADLYFHSEEALRAGLGVELLLGEAATGLDSDAREILVGDRRIGFDSLVIATGSAPRPLPAAPKLPGIMSMRTVDDALALKRAIDQSHHITVVGAGFVGAEAASVAHAKGVPVTIVESADVPLVRAVGHEMGAVLADIHAAHGMDIRCSTSIVEVMGDQHVEAARLSDGSVIETDLVLVGIGSIPSTWWLAESDVAIDNGIVCNEYLETSVSGIYAAGDVALWPNSALSQTMRLENWTSASEQGRVAGANAAGVAPAVRYSTVPYFWSDWYGKRIQFVGSAEGDGVEIVSGSADADRFVAAYRRGGVIVGALAVDYPSHIMKYRAMISRHTSWPDALAFAEARNARAAKAVPAQ